MQTAADKAATTTGARFFMPNKATSATVFAANTVHRWPCRSFDYATWSCDLGSQAGRRATEQSLLRGQARAANFFPLRFDKSPAYHASCRSRRGTFDGETHRVGSKPIDLPQGTLDLLILKTIARGPEHGWAIAQRIRSQSNDALQVRQGSLYPALHRLERRDLIKARWGTSENNRKARFYELTAAGKRFVTDESAQWDRLTEAVAAVLQAG
jgi:transcriptional regulator